MTIPTPPTDLIVEPVQSVLYIDAVGDDAWPPEKTHPATFISLNRKANCGNLVGGDGKGHQDLYWASVASSRTPGPSAAGTAWLVTITVGETESAGAMAERCLAVFLAV
jgi:hypothetical protein